MIKIGFAQPKAYSVVLRPGPTAFGKTAVSKLSTESLSLGYKSITGHRGEAPHAAVERRHIPAAFIP
jgi:hypothetical protein